MKVVQISSLIIVLNQLLDDTNALTSVQWVATEGKRLFPYTAEYPGVTKDDCINLCIKDTNCAGVVTYTCAEQEGDWCALADLTAAPETSSSDLFTVYEKSGPWNNGPGPARTGFTTDGSSLDLSSLDWNRLDFKKASTHPSFQQNPTTCNFDNPTVHNHVSHSGTYYPDSVLTKDFLPGDQVWLGSDNSNTPYFTFDYGCEFWLHSVDIRNAKRESHNDRATLDFEIQGSLDGSTFLKWSKGTFPTPCSDGSSGCPPLPDSVQVFGRRMKVRYVKFQCLLRWSVGCGISYFEVNPDYVCPNPSLERP